LQCPGYGNMAFGELRESIRVLGQTPELWISGAVAGALGAILWILFNLSGVFFTSRLVILAGLTMVLFVAGSFGRIKGPGTGTGAMLRYGVQYYFRVLLPWLVIMSVLLLVFVTITLVTVLFGENATDYMVTGVLAVLVMVPTLFVTFFCDTAAVFEDLRIFESLRRSITLTAAHAGEVLGFYVTCCLIAFADLFVFALVWEGMLYPELAPLAQDNQTQLANITPQQVIALIGPDGIWVTALTIFLALLFLVPVLLTYKACFFRALAGTPAPVQQMAGEFDSKGRWYKY